MFKEAKYFGKIIAESMLHSLYQIWLSTFNPALNYFGDIPKIFIDVLHRNS